MESLRPLLAIVWVQWRLQRNVYLRAHSSALILRWLLGLLWYGVWALGAFGAGFLVSGRVPMNVVERAFPGALFLVFFFWQLFPIILASQGAYLDVHRLLAYPIPPSQLFFLEAVLRVTTAIEMTLISFGLIGGLLLNPAVPLWGPAAIVLFMVLNLLLSTGVKSLLQRLFRKKIVRELLMVVFVGLILLPQFFTVSIADGAPPQFPFFRRLGPLLQVLPWTAAARLALGKLSILSVASLSLATALAYVFARLQFARSLLVEEDSGAPAAKPRRRHAPWWDRLTRWPSALLADPAAALIEKDLRSLIRAPRFRLIFLMASTFGAVLWLPQVMRNRDGWMAHNYVTLAVLYAMLVLGEVLYWNVLGFEKASAQQWFVTPVRFRDVLRAKNCVAAIFTFFAVIPLATIAAVLPIPVGLPQIADALAAAAVFLLCVMAGGNLTSVYNPRPISAEQAWRNSGSKTQFLLVFAYPVLATPIVLAHLARWATSSYWAYHGVLAISLVIALCFYVAATSSAETAAEERKEQIIATLARVDGPVSLNV